MKFTKQLEDSKADKIEVTKETKRETKYELQHKITPKKNHILFEIDTNHKTIQVAKYQATSRDLHWHEAISGKHLKIREVIKKQGAIYISALNERNARKQLEREYGLNEKEFVSNKISSLG